MWTWVLTALGGLWNKVSGGSDKITIKVLLVMFNTGNVSISQIEQELQQQGEVVPKEKVKEEIKALQSKKLIDSTKPLEEVENEDAVFTLTNLGQNYVIQSIETTLI